METLTKEYLLLFNTLTDAEESLRQLREVLQNAQRQAETLFMDRSEALPPEASDSA